MFIGGEEKYPPPAITLTRAFPERPRNINITKHASRGFKREGNRESRSGKCFSNFCFLNSKHMWLQRDQFELVLSSLLFSLQKHSAMTLKIKQHWTLVRCQTTPKITSTVELFLRANSLENPFEKVCCDVIRKYLLHLRRRIEGIPYQLIHKAITVVKLCHCRYFSDLLHIVGWKQCRTLLIIAASHLI